MDKVPEERTICPGVWKTNKSIIIVVEGGKGASCIYYCCAQTTYSFKPCFFPSMLCSLISSSPDRWLAFSTSRLSTRMIGISQPPSGCASAVTQSRQAKKTCSTMSSGPAPGSREEPWGSFCRPCPGKTSRIGANPWVLRGLARPTTITSKR